MPYSAFRRQPVPQQYEQQLQTQTLPAPTRGIIQSENESFMAAGGAIVQDNWAPTMRGAKLRGGCEVWATLPATPVISGFEYVSGNNQRMFAGQETELYEVTAAPVLVKSAQTSGNYCAAQLEDASGTDWMIVVNETGDPVLRFNGTTWATLPVSGAVSDGASTITGPAGVPAPRLSYVWKYRNRLYFIEASSMTAWYLGIDSIGGELHPIPLAGAATKGGKLIAGAVWSLDTGDGIDDKNVFMTDQGELMIFTGSNPADPANWRQEGRYALSPMLGMNAHISVGGDLLLLTVDGIIPVSQAINKEAGQLELAMLTRNIKPEWRRNVVAKRSAPWTARKWDEYGAFFVAMPGAPVAIGGPSRERLCLLANNVTGAWARFIGWDATCWIRLRADMFFGTPDGRIMQADRSGYDDGLPYVATLVGGWEMFGSPSNQNVWHQARATFHSGSGEPFQPQLSAAVDYIVTIPPPPVVGPDPGVRDVWDQGKWGPAGAAIPPTPSDILNYAQWDQPAAGLAPVRNTLWVSIGRTGYAHAPVVQVHIGQEAKPDVELISLTATYERAGVNV